MSDLETMLVIIFLIVLTYYGFLGRRKGIVHLIWKRITGVTRF